MNPFAESTCPIADLVGISGALLDDGGIPPPPDIIPDCLNAPLPLLPPDAPCAVLTPGDITVGYDPGTASPRFDMDVREGDGCCEALVDLDLALPCPAIEGFSDASVGYTDEPTTLAAAIEADPTEDDPCRKRLVIDLALHCPAVAWASGTRTIAAGSGTTGSAVLTAVRDEDTCDVVLDAILTAPCPVLLPSSGSPGTSALVHGATPLGSLAWGFTKAGTGCQYTLAIAGELPCPVAAIDAEAAVTLLDTFAVPTADADVAVDDCQHTITVNYGIPKVRPAEMLLCSGSKRGDGRYAAIVQHYSPSLGEWVNDYACWLLDANNGDLTPTKRYKGFFYGAGFDEAATPETVTGNPDDYSCLFITRRFAEDCDEVCDSGSSESEPLHPDPCSLCLSFFDVGVTTLVFLDPLGDPVLIPLNYSYDSIPPFDPLAGCFSGMGAGEDATGAFDYTGLEIYVGLCETEGAIDERTDGCLSTDFSEPRLLLRTGGVVTTLEYLGDNCEPNYLTFRTPSGEVYYLTNGALTPHQE